MSCSINSIRQCDLGATKPKKTTRAVPSRSNAILVLGLHGLQWIEQRCPHASTEEDRRCAVEEARKACRTLIDRAQETQKHKSHTRR